MARSEIPSPSFGPAVRRIPLPGTARIGVLAGFAVVLLLAGGAGILGAGRRSELELIGAAVVLAAAASLLACSRRALPERVAWGMFGVALLARGVAEVSNTALLPGVVLYYMAALTGVAILVREERQTWDSLLDPLAAGLAISAAASAAVDSVLAAKFHTSIWLAAAFGSSDAVLAGLTIALLAAHAWRPARGTLLLSVGLLGAVAADIFFVATDEPLRDFTSAATLVVWPGCATLIAIGARAWARPGESAPKPGRAQWWIGTPGAAVLAVGVMLSDAVVSVGRVPHTLAGAAILVVATRTALTMRHQRAAAIRLQAAEEQYRTLVEQMPAVTYVAELGETGKWDYVSPQVRRLLGYTADEFVARPSLWIELVHPEDRAQVIAGEEAFRTGEPTGTTEYRMIARDGRVLHVRDDAVRLGEDGRVLGFLVDVTARRHAQLDAQRRASQQSLVAYLGQQALAGVPLDALFEEAVESVAEALDAEFAEILELRREEEHLVLRAGVGWRGASVGSTTVDVEERSLAAATLASTTPVTVDDMRTETRFPGTAFLHRHRVISSVSVAIRHGDETFGVLAVHSARQRPFTREDAAFVETVAHALAAAVQRLRADAEQKEREELRARLEQAQRLETIGRLTSGIAHDFNNLLLIIKGYASFLENQVSDDVARGRIAQILQATDSAGALTRQLLLFGQRRHVEPTLVDVNAVIERIHKLLGHSLGVAIELDVRLEPGLPAVTVDPTQLEQVLLNLTVNARDAMPDGGRVTIETGVVTEAGGDAVRIAVRDTGFGMPPEVKERVFEAFFTTKPDGEGTGLGLATVHGIVSEAGGRIDIDSVPDAGTRIDVFLPAAA